MTSNASCASPTTAMSNEITMTVSSITPSVSIAAAPGNTVCTGTNVTFTATPTNGGTPSYQWKVNGVNAGTNSNTFQSSILVNGDVVTVVMTSSLACANPTTATSNSITMAVTGTVAPSVSIATAPGNTICTGTNVIFTAIPTNGGTPSYQWKVNGVNAGTNSNTFQSPTLVNGDVITVVMTSSLSCASATTATSNSITMAVNPNVSAGIVSGSTPLAVGSTSLYSSTGTAGGSWSSTNSGVATVSAVTGMVTTVSAGTTNITYTVNSGCGAPVSAFQTLNVTNNSGAVACGPKGDKVVVCHNGHEICIAAEALPAHLAHGDISGHCLPSRAIARNEPESERVNKLIVTAYPNPSETVFRLNITSPLAGMATIEFYTINGARIYGIRQYLIAGKTIIADIKSSSLFGSAIIYKVGIGKHQAHGIVFRSE